MSNQKSEYGGENIDGKSQYGGIRDDTRPPKEAITEDPKDASGFYDAFLSGLTNDETNKVFWLARRRFPELYDAGEDPSIYYGFDEDGDLFYRDPYTGENKKEFKDDPLGNDVDYIDNIGPAGQFLAEVITGTMGMMGGFISGGVPGAVIGGAKGTAWGGATAYGARQGFSLVLGGPPVEIEKAIKDLTVSSAFGAVPFGVPAKGATTATGRWLLDKFPGSDGRGILKDIVQNGGKTVDDKLAYVANKYPDVKISRAEANGLVGEAGYKAEVWISKHARNQKLIDHYESRNQRINYHAENFFDHILSGKLISGGLKTKLTSRQAIDPEMDIARAADDYIKAEKKKLTERVKPMYEDAYDMDVKIDVNDILKEINSVIANPNTSAQKLSAYKEMKKGLIDARFEGEVARSSTKLLHEGLKDNFSRLMSRLTKDADSPLKMEVSKIRAKLSNKIKSENPLYEQVTKLYDDALGTSQSLDRSIVGQFAKVAEKGGESAMRLTKKLFSGNIKPREITELKKILQSTGEGTQAWQNLKGTWLRTQWDDVIASQTNPLSEPSAFLRAMGIKQPAKAFPTEKVIYDATGTPLPATSAEIAKLGEAIVAHKAVGTKAKMWQAIFEPEELKNFVDLTNLMQMVGRIQTQAGSDTFGNIAMDALMSQEAKRIVGSGEVGKQAARSFGGLLTGIFNFSSRLTGMGFPLMSGVRRKQQEAYLDLLISHIIDPKKAVSMQHLLGATKPIAYLISQTFARSGAEGLDTLFNSIDKRNKALDEASQRRLEEKQNIQEGQSVNQDKQNLQSAIQNFQMPDINAPAFQSAEPDINPAMSPTILPNPQDRELAMRQSGIAGLVG